MMTRFVRRALLAAGVPALAGCAGAPTSVDTGLGPVLAVDTLLMTDGQPLPCCTRDSAGGQITIVGGTLTLRRLAHFTDTANTPGGAISAACVHEVPSGSTVYPNGLIVRRDGSGFLVMPCDTGTYSLALTRRLAFAGGRTYTLAADVSSGSYGSKPDTLTLLDDRLGTSLATAIAWDTIGVTAGGHRLRFIAGSTR
jgi:hypothetical protein